MSKKQKVKYESDFKAKVALEAFRETKTITELSSEYNLHHSVIRRWIDTAKQNIPIVFEDRSKEIKHIKMKHEEEKGELYKQIGELSIQLSWLKKKCTLGIK